MVASLVTSSRSRRRSSVTSRSRISAPTCSPSARNGIARRNSVTSPLSTSTSAAALPVTTAASCSSTNWLPRISSPVTAISRLPTRSVISPSRRYADSAFGLANVTMPARSIRMQPSPTRGDVDSIRSPL